MRSARTSALVLHWSCTALGHYSRLSKQHRQFSVQRSVAQAALSHCKVAAATRIARVEESIATR